jgi:hypothetical protein
MISPISSSRVTAAAPMQPEEVFKKIDGANKGYFVESELASAIVKISPQGVSRSQAEAQAKEVFAKMDADGNGQVSQIEFKAAAPQNSPNGGPPPGQPPGPPGGLPPGGGPAAAKGVDKAASSQSFDPADRNSDGTVSDLERMTYNRQYQVSAAYVANSSPSEATNSWRA